MQTMAADEACHELPTAKWNVVLTTILGLLIAITACTTNVLILIAIYKKQTLHSVTNYFLASLAVGDFFVGIVALPLWITRSLLAVADEEHPLSISVDCVYKHLDSPELSDSKAVRLLASQMHNKKASITIAIVIGVFILTSLPALAFSIAEVASEKDSSCQENKTMESWGTWALFLAYSNAAINPWIYAARKSEFRDALKVLMFWKHQE
ncbi:hypothetical protein ACROYT_G006773 [Oculina patagonica]